MGILAYEFIHGQPPFYVKDRKEKQARILQGQLKFSDAFSKNAQVRGALCLCYLTLSDLCALYQLARI